MKLDLGVSTKTFEGLLKEFKKLEIPDFQRPYEWRSEHWSELWNDVLEHIDQDYLMGGIVLCGNDNGTELVIDGQQRISTITLLLAACRDYLYRECSSAEARDLADELHKGYIVSGGKLDERNEVYIILGEIDRAWFSKRIQVSPKSKGEFAPPDIEKISYNLPSSVRLLWKGYRFFYQELKKRHSDSLAFPGVDSKSDDVMKIARQLAKKTWFVVTRVPDDNQAYTLFEVLNDRGLELSISDLIKNKVLSRAAELKKLEKAKELWSGIVETLDHENVASFIRYYWMSKNGEKVTEKDLFPILKKEIKDKASGAQLMSYLSSISEEAEAFAEIIGRPKTKTSAAIQRELGYLNSYGFRISNTALLAIWTTTKDEKTRLLVLREIKSFLIKYATFGGQVTNKLEATLAKVSFAIRKDLSTGLSKMKDSFSKALPPKDTIKSGFTVLEPTIPVGRALLTEIEHHIAGVEKTIEDAKQVHVEHVFPQSPNQQWIKNFAAGKGEEESYTGRLGNMTLLDELLNKQCGNKPFADKQKEYYSKSDITITKELLKNTTWTTADVDKRQTVLYGHACKIWGI